MKAMAEYRAFLKSDHWKEWDDLETDQKKGAPPLPLQKHCPDVTILVDLIPCEELTIGQIPLIEAMEGRKSRRKYLETPLTLEELSFLLWATQGVRKVIPSIQASLRTVPSGGARHPFETYVLVNRVEGLEAGLYRYLPLEHRLCYLSADPQLVEQMHKACLEQYVEDCAVAFFWAAIPYRTEWRYSILAHKIIALDAGHLCQNLYLAAEAMGVGVCAIGAYDQEALDRILQLDGEDEFVVYLATVGKVR